MKQETLKKILDNIRTIKLDGEYPPKVVSHLVELKDYGNFNIIVNKVRLNEISLKIPNHKLYESYNFVVPDDEITVNNLFLNIPFILAFFGTIYGIYCKNYWLLSLIPVAFLSTWISAIFGGFIFYLIVISATIYLLFYGNQTIGIVCLTSLITIFGAHYLRIHRRNSLNKLALQNEEIFCFLFYSKTLSIYDRKKDKTIYSGIRY